MTTLKIPDMHCEKCVERISSALKTADIGFEISLKDKIVSVPDDRVEAAREALDDLGFDTQI